MLMTELPELAEINRDITKFKFKFGDIRESTISGLFDIHQIVFELSCRMQIFETRKPCCRRETALCRCKF